MPEENLLPPTPAVIEPPSAPDTPQVDITTPPNNNRRHLILAAGIFPLPTALHVVTPRPHPPLRARHPPPPPNRPSPHLPPRHPPPASPTTVMAPAAVTTTARGA